MSMEHLMLNIFSIGIEWCLVVQRLPAVNEGCPVKNEIYVMDLVFMLRGIRPPDIMHLGTSGHLLYISIFSFYVALDAFHNICHGSIRILGKIFIEVPIFQAIFKCFENGGSV